MSGLERADAAMPGIASLESPLVQHSRREIRTLTAEIAALAHRATEAREFYLGFLSRVTTAIGAAGGAIWQVHSSEASEHDVELGQFERLESLHLPACLLAADGAPSDVQARMLAAVLAEGQPMLIPPGQVKLEVTRPNNPLDHSLIIVPVVIQESIEYFIEIIQRPSGGPATQRGYLRFVAQMADLFADHQRQLRLRRMTAERMRGEQVGEALVELSQAATTTTRQRAAVGWLRRLAEADQGVLLASGPACKVLAIADTSAFDPRSELIVGIEQLLHRWQSLAAEHGGARVQRLNPFETRAVTNAEEPSWLELDPAFADQARRICQQLDCQSLLWIPLGSRIEPAAGGVGERAALLGWRKREDANASDWMIETQAGRRLTNAIGVLLDVAPDGWWQPWWRRRASAPKSAMWRWGVRAVAAGCVLGIGIVPMPQRIRATATLHPTGLQHYYAPLAGTVEQMLVKEGADVSVGQPLIAISNIELDANIRRLVGERERLRDAIAEYRERLGKAGQANLATNSDWELQLHRAEVELDGVEQELGLREQQREGLTIRARASGRVAIAQGAEQWSGRHVSIHDRLLLVFNPEERWRCDVAIPERRLGLLTSSGSRGAASIALVLHGFPDTILEGTLERLGDQAVTSTIPSQPQRSERVVLANAYFESRTLPILKDGMQARATIDCGRTPLLWLVVRDAYHYVSSSIRLWW